MVVVAVVSVEGHYVNKTITKPGRVRFYPKNSVFRKSDLIDKGCSVFLKECPAAYKCTKYSMRQTLRWTVQNVFELLRVGI
ncbi:unnamed protein product [Leptosia nina]|uniref:Uncharacterized protein n=1 Tax=Leptosia nina TaxID=320188 RepID=A0AAV1IVC5_9NEOP